MRLQKQHQGPRAQRTGTDIDNETDGELRPKLRPMCIFHFLQKLRCLNMVGIYYIYRDIYIYVRQYVCQQAG